MEKYRPTIVPPMARLPQVPPQQVADNRRVYIPATFKRVPRPPYTPLPIPSLRTSPRFIYPTPTHAQMPSAGQPGTPFPVGHISPAFPLPTTPRKPPLVPRTPELLTYPYRSTYTAASRGIQPGAPLRSAPLGIPVTPPISIPGYAPSRVVHEEPGVAETLLGCGTLMLIGVVFLAILYYLST